MEMEAKLTCPGCPVQFEGTVDGHPWYFRARYQSWSFQIAESPDAEPVLVGWEPPRGVAGWTMERPWIEEDEYGAGYKPHRHALRLIYICLRWWSEGRLPRAYPSA